MHRFRTPTQLNLSAHPVAFALCIASLSSSVHAQPAAQPAPAAAAPGAPAAPPAAAPPAGAAPAAAPGAPAAPPAGAAPAAPPGPAVPPETSSLTLRDVPELDEPLMQAFSPKPGGLTANEVARRAVVSSDTLRAKRAEIEAAAAKVDQAVATFLPRLTLSASYTRLSRVDNSLASEGGLVGAPLDTPILVGPCPAGNPPGTTGCVLNAQAFSMEFPSPVNNYSLKANLAVPFSDYLLRLSNSIATTKHEKRAAELNAQAEQRKVAADARVAFYNWTRGIGQLVVSQKSLERVRARLKDAEVAFELGAATRADVLRLQALVASTEAGIEAVRAFRAITAEQLSTIMNDERREYEIGESVTVPVAPLPPGASLQQYIAEANAQRLELRALGEASQALDKSVKVMKRGELPRLDGFAEYNYANPNQRYFVAGDQWNGTWMAGLQLSWTINDVFSNGAVAKELEARRAGLEAQAQALRDGVRMEVVSAYLEGQKAHAALEAARRGTEAARAAYDTATELYRVGRATTTEVIDAESELVAALLQLVNTLIDERVARTQLAYATGEDVTRVK